MSFSFEPTELEKLLKLLLHFEGYTDTPDSLDIKLTQRNFTKTQIILQSAAIFAQKGVSETSVQDLLEASNVSRRTFYKYFSDKFDVLENIYRLSINMFSKRLTDEISQAKNVGELIEQTIESYFSYHTSMGNMIRIMHEDTYRQGSSLYERRIFDREAFVETFQKKLKVLGYQNKNIMIFQSIFWILEDASMYLLTETPCEKEDVERVKKELNTVFYSMLGV